jgi:hypothetical protein
MGEISVGIACAVEGMKLTSPATTAIDTVRAVTRPQAKFIKLSCFLLVANMHLLCRYIHLHLSPSIFREASANLPVL